MITGSGSEHRLYRVPVDLEVKNDVGRWNKARIAFGVDVRGDGGYIIAAPSTLLRFMRARRPIQ